MTIDQIVEVGCAAETFRAIASRLSEPMFWLGIEGLGAFAENLQTNELSIDDNSYVVRIHSFVCDASARAYIKNLKGHLGYFG